MARGRAVTLIARPYAISDWFGEGESVNSLANDQLVFTFHRDSDGRAVAIVRDRSVVITRVIVDPRSGRQYFVDDEQRIVRRTTAVPDWSWDFEYERLRQSTTSVRLIRGLQAHLARSWGEGPGRHELWVNIDLKIPVAEMSSSCGVMVDHTFEEQPAELVFQYPSHYDVADVL